MTQLANRQRPKTLADVVGQESEVNVIRSFLEKNWKPNAVMLTGPWGTGKTTLGRLIARALLCDHRQPNGKDDQNRDRYTIEPCGTCDSCQAMDADNHPNYIEIDSAGQGLVADVRNMKDLVSYQTSNGKPRVLCYDESHMLSAQAQNALLQILEEGNKGILFVFCTTESGKMLPTIRSRCVELKMKLLTPSQISARLMEVAKREGISLEEKAARIIGTYVRGHVRDSLVLLEQLANMSGHVDEKIVRTYLRLDKFDEVYQFLTEKEKRTALTKLENLLCNYASAELAEIIGEVLLNAYKISQGVGDFTEVDTAWLKRVLEARGRECLSQAEKVLRLNLDFGTIQLGLASLANILLEDTEEKVPARSLRPSGPSVSGSSPGPEFTGRKPGKDAAA